MEMRNWQLEYLIECADIAATIRLPTQQQVEYVEGLRARLRKRRGETKEVRLVPLHPAGVVRSASQPEGNHREESA